MLMNKLFEMGLIEKLPYKSFLVTSPDGVITIHVSAKTSGEAGHVGICYMERYDPNTKWRHLPWDAERYYEPEATRLIYDEIALTVNRPLVLSCRYGNKLI